MPGDAAYRSRNPASTTSVKPTSKIGNNSQGCSIKEGTISALEWRRDSIARSHLPAHYALLASFRFNRRTFLEMNEEDIKGEEQRIGRIRELSAEGRMLSKLTR